MDDKFRIGAVVFDHWHIARLLRSGTSGNLYQLLYHDRGRDFRAMMKVVSVPKNLKELIRIQQGTVDHRVYFDSVLEFMIEEVEILSMLSGNPYVMNYFDHKVERHPSGMGYDLLLRMEQQPCLWEHTLEHKLSRQEVLKMGIDLCYALEECHEKHIIHRDIRPEHIYVTSSGGFKLGDFGIPCVDARDLPSVDGYSWEYMAPELYRDEDYDYRVDLYALGMVLYSHLNDGRLPFYPSNASHEGKEQARARRMRGEVWSTAPALKRGKIGKILAKACHFEPRLRYQSAEEFRKDLEVALQKEGSIITLPVDSMRGTVESLGKGGPKQLLASWFG